jgi:hypothetical protein
MFGVASEHVACGWNGAATPQTHPKILRPSANSFANVERSGSGKQARGNRGMMNTQNRANKQTASSADLNGITNRGFIEGHESLD